MARAIDGDELLGIERLLDTDVIRKSKTASWLLDQVLHDIQAMPTLALPDEPLTPEQLREMNGQPVWIKQLKGLSVCDTDWAVVEFRLAPDVKHDKIRVWWPGSEDEDTPSEDDYGKTWLAYRRPPEGEGEPNGYERAEEKHENKG